jgi:hypothetical protein
MTDSTVALVREKLKMMADEPTYHGIVCGKALALIERQQRELEAAEKARDHYKFAAESCASFSKVAIAQRDARIAGLVGALERMAANYPAVVHQAGCRCFVCEARAALQGNSGKGEGDG